MFRTDARPGGIGRILRVNHAFERIVGRPPEEVKAVGWAAMTHPDDREEGQELMQALVAGEVESVEQDKRYVRPDGQVVWAHVTASVVRDASGAPLHWITQVEDVTERKRTERDISCQFAVTDVLARAADLADAVPEVLDLLARRLDWDGAAFATCDPEGLPHAPAWFVGEPLPEDARCREWACRHAHVVWQRMGAGRLQAAMPVALDGTPLAVVEFALSCEDPSPFDLALLDQVATQLAMFLDRVRRTERLAGLERAAATDPLTGLPNRRSWDDRLPRELARSHRDGSLLAIAVLDLDHFKAFNDTHGHPAGDALLRACAAAWSGVVRRSDLLARYGGEEFALLLPDCDLDAAYELVERLQAVIPHGQTCSVGLAVAEPQDDPSELVQRADQALYAAKRAGRNRVVAALPDELVQR